MQQLPALVEGPLDRGELCRSVPVRCPVPVAQSIFLGQEVLDGALRVVPVQDHDGTTAGAEATRVVFRSVAHCSA
jgi:hypothetical protein